MELKQFAECSCHPAAGAFVSRNKLKYTYSMCIIMNQNFHSQIEKYGQKNKKKYIHIIFTKEFIHLLHNTTIKFKTLTNMNKIVHLLDFEKSTFYNHLSQIKERVGV